MEIGVGNTKQVNTNIENTTITQSFLISTQKSRFLFNKKCKNLNIFVFGIFILFTLIFFKFLYN